jgi:PKD repeat protein
MQRGGIMKTTAAILAAELPKFYESKDIPNKLLILVDAFFIKSGQPLIESRFDFRIGQQGEAPYKNLRDFNRPSRWWWEGVAAESDINSIVNREAWPGDVKNSNTILVVLTNSRKSLDADDVIAINKSAEKIGSKIIQVILPRPDADNTDDGLKIELNKIISKLLQKVKLEMQNVSAKFEALPIEGDAPLKVTFKNMSENATAFTWDFGNEEEKSDKPAPEVTYTKPGKYPVILTATNGVKTRDFKLTVTVNPKLPEIKAKVDVQLEPAPQKPAKALFEARPLKGDSPLEVTFTNKSENALKVRWDFGDSDAKENSSEDLSTKHTYTNSNSNTRNFEVTLKATGADGKISEYKKIINVNPKKQEDTLTPPLKPTACFSADPIKGKAPLEVTFKNTSENANSFRWDFGDGEKSNDKKPKHTFEKAGNYKVKLTVYGDNEKETDPFTKEITVEKGGSSLSVIITFLIIVVGAAAYFLFRFIFPPKILNVVYKRNRQPTENSPQKLKKSISMAAVFGCERNFKIFICLDTESDETKIQFFSLEDKQITLQSALDPNRTIALQKDTMTNPAKLGEYKILGTNDSFEVMADSEEA